MLVVRRQHGFGGWWGSRDEMRCGAGSEMRDFYQIKDKEPAGGELGETLNQHPASGQDAEKKKTNRKGAAGERRDGLGS